MSKKIRLNENHPTSQKLEKLFELMDELKLTIDVSNIRTVITDHEHNVEATIIDAEHQNAHVNYIMSFPPGTEYILLKGIE